MLSPVAMTVPSASIRVTPRATFPSWQQRRSTALGGGVGSSSGGRAWVGSGRGVGSTTRGGRRASGGVRVMARGKKDEPTNQKQQNKGKDNKSNDKDQQKKSSGKTEQKTGTAVGTSPLPSPAGGVPLPALGGGLLLGLVILAKLIKGKSKGSVTALEERGTLQPERNVDEEKFYKGMMKQVRTVEMPALSDAQIQAARERRRQSHFDDEQDARGSLANANVPANHPWATNEKLSAAEKRDQEKRVRDMNKPRTRQRGTPPPPSV